MFRLMLVYLTVVLCGAILRCNRLTGYVTDAAHPLLMTKHMSVLQFLDGKSNISRLLSTCLSVSCLSLTQQRNHTKSSNHRQRCRNLAHVIMSRIITILQILLQIDSLRDSPQVGEM